MDDTHNQELDYVLLEHAKTNGDPPVTTCRFCLIGPHGLIQHTITLENDRLHGYLSPLHAIAWAIGEAKDGATIALATTKPLRNFANKTPAERLAAGYTTARSGKKVPVCGSELWQETIDPALKAKRIKLTAREPIAYEDSWHGLLKPESILEGHAQVKAHLERKD